MYVIGLLIIGSVAGLLTGWYRKGRGADWVGYVVVGVTGSTAGGMLFETLAAHRSGQLESFVAAAAGAAVFLILIEVAKRV
jgi:uncharacterized membrane protein YeaQ/YmgE (transglycosylase-associated protein family)